MQTQILNYLNNKNNWLAEQVNVAFPTPQSIEGRDLYLQAEKDKAYTLTQQHQLLTSAWIDEVVLVDFHRLTIIFSVLQATQWASEPEKEKLVIEFLTQIILSDEYQLYVGFVGAVPAAALIGKLDIENQMIVLSDVVIAPEYKEQKRVNDFLSDVLCYLEKNGKNIRSVIHPTLEKIDD